jgi:hypothetical protein
VYAFYRYRQVMPAQPEVYAQVRPPRPMQQPAPVQMPRGRGRGARGRGLPRGRARGQPARAEPELPADHMLYVSTVWTRARPIRSLSLNQV